MPQSDSRHIRWQGHGQELHQSEHSTEHRLCWQAAPVTTSHSRLHGSDVTQRENSILTEDHMPQPSHVRATASDGLATPK